MQLRLQKYIRDCIGISRRAADELVREGKVLVNDQVAALGTVIETDSDKVIVEGKLLEQSKKLKYIMINKPAGYITSRSDPQERRTIYSLLPAELGYLFPVGRLDFYSEGLLILTNDGTLAFNLTHPKFEIEKEYEVTVDGPLAPNQLAEIERGIKSEIITTSNAKVKVVHITPTSTIVRITVHEGQNREIRRIFEYFNRKVLKLKRIRVNKLTLGNLDTAEWRELQDSEVSLLS